MDGVGASRVVRHVTHAARGRAAWRGREVEIGEETAGETDSPNLITKGTVEAIHDDLALALKGQSEPVHRGRLVFAD